MRSVRLRVYVHIVWATWDRQAWLRPEWQPAVFGCMQQEAARLGAEVVAIGGTENHVHCLVRISATAPISQLVNQMKGVSSHLISHRLDGSFRWQGAYAATSVAPEGVPAISAYIHDQPRHHADATAVEDHELPAR